MFIFCSLCIKSKLIVFPILKQGSYGVCHEAIKVSTNERFACKVFNKAEILEWDTAELVRNEISIHSALKHLHVVQFVESFADDRFVYMVQALCSSTLRHFHKSFGVGSVDQVRYFVSQILEGVRYIHEKKYIHRDMKLSNVFLDENMQIKIGDFGLAIHVEDPRLDEKHICGTINYLAPEVVSYKGFSCLTDVWAIGVITFVLMFGFKPFKEDFAYETQVRISRAEYK